jgi:hypothetical protein
MPGHRLILRLVSKPGETAPALYKKNLPFMNVFDMFVAGFSLCYE